ncbi:Cupin domain protein [Pseudomonas koreensis]|uniref:cupin domain-containing protein n=1 Tax=Pseudomonas TaxID=286 RepID=UPI00087B3EA7|nr:MULTISPECIES: cupin domain-containing protein [Pseudomonas]KAB0513962.1 cupin domain-containing protein [Pseudomonas koreensis]MCM8744363.1 cupin domain-containing protein [Pseudomonas koreensis]NNA56387.1 cupin domain-containing protein [Pseudomonas koreensis]NNA63255.1 cupin domain-containing protein [Pseudomonas koreensis]SDE52702.1 Cupin domain protein [Pseudomonas koreensis]
MQRTLILATVAALVSFTGLAQAADAQAMSWQQGLSRTDLIRQDLGAADREVIQARIDFEPGVTAPRHAHPGVEVAYVISGTLEYQLEGRPAVTLKAGDSLFIPAGVAHVAKNVGSDKGVELATYVVNKGQALLQLKP